MKTLNVLLLVLTGATAFKLTPQMKTFGHSIKNGHLLPKGNEITTFEHTCGTPPCAITQLHCPTAGPANWQNAVVRIYVDGDMDDRGPQYACRGLDRGPPRRLQ